MSPTAETYDKFNSLLNASSKSTHHRTPHDITHRLDKIRKKILLGGIPHIVGRPNLRPRIWKLMLGVDQLYPEDYLRHVSMGPSEVSTKSRSRVEIREVRYPADELTFALPPLATVKSDTFRTLATDIQFKGKVKEDMLVRLLDAFVWKNKDRESERDGLPFTYVQGMNVLSAPFLYTMPTQLEAFACFSKFIETCCPLYVQPTLVGVHKGLKLLDKCLKFLDFELYEHLQSKNLSAELYAFPSVLTLCACTPPLDEVLKIWDFLLAFGVHLNILCVIAQIVIMRDDLLASPSPMKLLRTFPPLDAGQILHVAFGFTGEISDEIYAELVAHTRVEHLSEHR